MVNRHENLRIVKQNMISQTCKEYKEKLNDGIDLELMISLVCVKFGAGHRYVMEIIKDLVNVGVLELKNKKLIFIASVE